MKVVRHVPDEVMARFDYNLTSIPTIRVQAWATVKYYNGEVYPLLKEHGYVYFFLTLEICCIDFVSSFLFFF